MRRYLALSRATARSVLAYRLDLVLAMFGLLFQLFSLLAVWHAILDGHPVGGFDWPQMKAYLLVGFVSGSMISAQADFGMAYRIRNGMVSIDLVRPVDYQTARFAAVVGGVWFDLLSAFAVCVGVVVVSGPVPWPPPARLAAFGVSLLAVLPLKFCVVYLTGLLCFWTKNYVGVNWMRLAVVGLFSGALVPLSFFPATVNTVVGYLPFAGMVYTPALIFIGKLHGATALRAIAIQLGWVVLLWFGARLAWRTAVRQLTVHGG